MTAFHRGVFLLLFLICVASNAIANAQPYYHSPAISGDGTKIAFVYEGNIFEVPVMGGEARLIIGDSSYDSHPRYSPDGEWLAFTSDRSGDGDVYVVRIATKELRRLTWHSAEDETEGWSADSRQVYFSSSRHDIAGYSDIFAVCVDGGTPAQMSRDRYENEYNAAISPDGRLLAFNSNDRVRQWWRKGIRRNDATDIWIKSNVPDAIDYRQVTHYTGKDSWPMWAPDGDGLYFVTDSGNADGSDNIAYQSLEGERRLITNFTTGRVLWPDISGTGIIVFERDFQIWQLTPGKHPVPISITVSTERLPDIDKELILDNDVSEFTLSPDETALAFVCHGEVFVLGTDTAGAPHRITWTPSPEKDVIWTPDGTSLIYCSLQDGFFNIYIHNLESGSERQITRGENTEHAPRISPDGAFLAYAHGTEGITVLDLVNGNTRATLDGTMLEPLYAWSPVHHLLAFVKSNSKWYSNLVIASIDQKDQTPVQASTVPHTSFGDIAWYHDGTSLVFSSAYHRRNSMTFKFDSRSSEHAMHSTETTADIDNGNGSSESHVSFDESIRDRTIRLIADVDDANLVAIAPDDREFYYIARTSNGRSLKVASLEDRSGKAARELASGYDFDNFHLARSGTSWYLHKGRIYRLARDEREPQLVPVQVSLRIDKGENNVALFREAWTVFRDYYGDATMNNLDWSDQYDQYLPYIRNVTTEHDFIRLLELMIGELDGSHNGIRLNHDRSDVQVVADLGVDFDQSVLHETGQYLIADVISGGPVDRSVGPSAKGSMLLSLDGKKLMPGSNVNRLLEGKDGQSIEVTLSATEADSTEMTSMVQGTSNRQVNRLRYERWAKRNAALIDSLSDHRLAYVHLQHLGTGSIESLEMKLDTQMRQKDGLVLDIRYNGGGWASTAIAELLNRKGGPTGNFRNQVSTPTGIMLGVTVIDLPTVLVQNEQCLSDAENFSDIYRTQGLGTVVGMPTAAWNRGGRSYTLFDGSRIGVGAWTTFAVNSENMDREPRPVDVRVDRPIGESLTGQDSQLSAAVSSLLSELDSR